MEKCVLTGNHAGERGGGIFVEGNVVLTGCRLADNTSDPNPRSCWESGGAIWAGNATIRNCLITGNSYCAVVVVDAAITQCTIAGNLGAGIFVETYGHATVSDCVVWGNSGESIIEDEYLGQKGVATVSYSDIDGGWAGSGAFNINQNPLFVTSPCGDYYLSQVAAGQAADSPCVDAGSDLAVNLGMDKYTTRTDYVNDVSIVDMGYHYGDCCATPNPADIDGDGRVDWTDYVILADQWQGLPGVPSADIAPPGGDGVVDGKDLGLLCENWLWGK